MTRTFFFLLFFYSENVMIILNEDQGTRAEGLEENA